MTWHFSKIKFLFFAAKLRKDFSDWDVPDGPGRHLLPLPQSRTPRFYFGKMLWSHKVYNTKVLWPISYVLNTVGSEYRTLKYILVSGFQMVGL